MILLSVINESTVLTDANVQAMLPAFDQQWNQDLKSVWNVDSATFTLTKQPASGSWWVVFLDNSDQAGALAYHDLTAEGLPISKIFVKTLMEDHASVSVGATHELCEMAVDPWLNSAYQDMHGAFWAGEVCDPVESDVYGYTKAGILVTDFVTPNWFGHQHLQKVIDFKQRLSQPFKVLSGGYAQKFIPGHGWMQVNGEHLTSLHQALACEGSRRERRTRGRGNWALSAKR